MNVLVSVDDTVEVAVVTVFEAVVDSVLETVEVADLVFVDDTEVEAVEVNVDLAHRLNSPLADFVIALFIIATTSGQRPLYEKVTG